LIPDAALKQLYRSSPSWLQRASAPLFPLRAGRVYRQTAAGIQATEFSRPMRGSFAAYSTSAAADFMYSRKRHVA
jgi:hypothetical protein